LRAARGQSMPVYSNGSNIRDWLHVTDHCDAIARVLQRGRAGQTYHIGGHAERTNIDVVQSIADAVDERLGRPTGSSRRLIEFVDDRPGHDYRYALDSSKTEAELNWRPAVSFESGLMETIDWYLAADDWITATASNVHHG
ncbi:MAG: GDP-mannose 4,6-dehydratase, partial [Planctomycetota bacterium]